jgi:restriction endonuclease S subunit
MAIAEDIGYDATGKSTNNNELDFIGRELARFIESIESGKDGFFLGLDVDKTRTFLVNCIDLNERLDPLYYKSIKGELIANKTKYDVKKLADVAFLSRGRFSFRPRNDPRFYNGQYPFIQTGDVVTASETHGDIQYNQTLNEEGLKVSKLFQPNIILITIAANIGDTAILRYSACFPDSVVAIKPKNNNLSVDYLNYYLKYVKSYLVDLAPQSAQKNINLQQLSPTPVVIPPKEIQDKIVAKMDDAYAAKKQKELEAQRLLDSIDDYLLGELGIELPEPEENTIQNRIFIRNLSEVSGDRFDCNYNHKINYILSQTGNYKIEYLKNLLIKPPQYGANEIAIDKNNSGEINYIRITDIDDLGFLKVRGLKTALKIEDKYILNQHDLLFARSGSVGRCYLHQDNKQKAIFAGYLIRFVLNTQIANPYYIFYYCHSKIYKMWVDAISRYAVQSNINSEEYKSLPIILPPLEKQIEISEHITAIRNQAKQLQQQAKDDLEKAKQEVEAMILGDD